MPLRFINKRVGFLLCLIMVAFLPACLKTQQTTIKASDKDQTVHSSHLSSGWYPQDSDKLSLELAKYFDVARKEFGAVVEPNSVRALIVPHAGIFYSGLCAASAYQTLVQPTGRDQAFVKNKKIKKVFILCPSHSLVFNGIALPHFSVYRTVLGDVHVDMDIVKKLTKNVEYFKAYPMLADVFSKEHGIEIQLPFLQKTIHDFKIVPMIVGRIKDNLALTEIVKSFKKYLDDDSLVVVSSDFTHFGPAYKYNAFGSDKLASIRYIDSLAVRAIAVQSLGAFVKVLEETESTICGQEAIKILLGMFELGFIKDVEAKVTCYYSSSQAAGAYDSSGNINAKMLFNDLPDESIDNCVSYVGMVFAAQKQYKLKEKDKLTGYEKKALLACAKTAICNALKEQHKTPDHLVGPLVTPGLEKMAGCFVTLTKKDGNLRGCIGSVSTDNVPLFKMVPQMAKAAAFSDTRFKPVAAKELDDLIFDITVLNPIQEIESYKEIKIGKHGVILNKYSGGLLTHSAVFLPQVPAVHKWSVEETLSELSLKAGLNADSWKEDCKFFVFEGFEIKE